MQGACVYINHENIPTILMYKELEYGLVFVLFYNKRDFYGTHITIKELTDKFPHDCIHILYSLPYNDDYEKMVESWRKLVKERLISMNNEFNKNSPSLIPIQNFKERFSLNNVPQFKL